MASIFTKNKINWWIINWKWYFCSRMCMQRTINDKTGMDIGLNFSFLDPSFILDVTNVIFVVIYDHVFYSMFM